MQCLNTEFPKQYQQKSLHISKCQMKNFHNRFVFLSFSLNSTFDFVTEVNYL